MSVLKIWAGASCLTIALSSGLMAEVTVSQSNDPSAAMDSRVTRLLVQEHTMLAGVDIAILAGTAPDLAPVARASSSTAPAGGMPFWGRGKAVPAGPRVTDPVWLAAQPVPKGDANFQCLATALYFEARGEGVEGQVAVAEVILNRVDSGLYPRTVCGVVKQGGRGGCQFSYTCDGRADTIRERGAYEVSARIARAMLDGAPRRLTDGATHFHTPAVRPGWSKRFVRTARIGRHIFYRQPGALSPMPVVAEARPANTPWAARNRAESRQD